MYKDNPTLRYFDAEMRYLREAVQEFAKQFPEQAAQLNLDKPGAADPVVERLFQGFAFSMGRLREKLDDDLPELTEGLVGLLWPQYLRAIPSLTIVELKPDITQMKGNLTLAKGFEVLSQPVGSKPTQCRFRTTQDLELRPLTIESLSHGLDSHNRPLLRVRIARAAHVAWSEINLANITAYLHAQEPQANALLRAFTLHTQGVYLKVAGRERVKLEGRIKVGGFRDEERLWPTGGAGFSGYQLLLEYFSFREKYMFVQLCGVESANITGEALWFELEVMLSEPWADEWPLSSDLLNLHAVPAINLFPLDSDPLTLDPFQTDYLLRSRQLQRGHVEIYSVDRVCTSARSAPREYVPFSTFQHKGGMLQSESPERYFHTRLKRGASGLHDTWLVLGGDGFEEDRRDKPERLSLQLTGTNGLLPCKVLHGTLLDTPGKVTEVDVKVRNLCPPSLPCYPPEGDRFHWQIFSHLGSTFLPMLDSAEVLRGTLALYEWTGSEANRRRLQAIVKVEHFLLERFEGGYLLRGVDIVVTLDPSGFTGEGDVMVFGEILNRFFALYADIHLFNQLTLLMEPAGKNLRWKENHSKRIPG